MESVVSQQDWGETREWKCFYPTVYKVSKYWGFSGVYFPVFGLNTEIYSANLHIQTECRKMRTRKNSVFEQFSRSDVKYYKW